MPSHIHASSWLLWCALACAPAAAVRADYFRFDEKLPGPELLVEAVRGDARAQLRVSAAFADANRWEASRIWLEKAASQGLPEAVYALGERRLLDGHKEEAIALYRRAAEAGHLPAEFALVDYLEGMLPPGTDIEKASREKLRDLARRGYVPAMRYLADKLLSLGSSAARPGIDVQEALAWQIRAARTQGVELEADLDVDPDQLTVDRAEELYLKQFENAGAVGLLRAAWECRVNERVRRNLSRAESYLKRAVDLGNPHALRLLATLYLDHTPPDRVRAFEVFRKIAIANPEDAEAHLEAVTCAWLEPRISDEQIVPLSKRILHLGLQSKDARLVRAIGGLAVTRPALFMPHFRSLGYQGQPDQIDLLFFESCVDSAGAEECLEFAHVAFAKRTQHGDSKGRQWLERAIARGSHEARHVAAQRLMNATWIDTMDMAAVLKPCLDAAEPAALLLMGVAHRAKNLVSAYSEAEKCFRAALQAGKKEAEYHLGEVLMLGPKENQAEAFRLLQSAAAGGNAAAERLVAQAYVRGAGVEANRSEGMRRLHTLAGKGDAEAMLDLYVLTADGGDETSAAYWIRQVRSSKHPRAEMYYQLHCARTTSDDYELYQALRFLAGHRWALSTNAQFRLQALAGRIQSTFPIISGHEPLPATRTQFQSWLARRRDRAEQAKLNLSTPPVVANVNERRTFEMQVPTFPSYEQTYSESDRLARAVRAQVDRNREYARQVSDYVTKRHSGGYALPPFRP